MHHDGGLELGMFLGGLVMALPPIAISVGFLLWAIKERQRARAAAAVAAPRETEDAA